MAWMCRIAHKGSWKQIWPHSVEGHCLPEARTCERCGARSVRTQHRVEWAVDFESPGSCRKRGTCKCGRVNRERVVHNLSAGRCGRCGGESNDWGGWV